MSGVVESLFGLRVPHGKLTECITALESGLSSINETPYHSVLGRDFLHHVEDAANMLVAFYRGTSSRGPLKAVYFEMNGFTINPNRWHFSGFGYRKGGDIWDLTWNTEWLSPWDEETSDFTLTGMEPVQDAFKHLFGDEKQPLGTKLAAEVAEHLVVARFNELIVAVHQEAKDWCPDLDGVPVLSTAHDWDTLCPSL